MKPFFILLRIITVGLIWGIFFIEGVRVIMLKNWRFDIVKAEHWQYAKDLWLSGWVIDDLKEWAFVLILITFIPLLLTGWAALSMITYSKYIGKVIAFPINLINNIVSRKTREVADKLAAKTVVRKKSHKEIRPPARDGSRPQEPSMAAAPRKTANSISLPAPQKTPVEKKPSIFEHSLFDFDEDDDFEFDLDAPVEKKEKPQPKAPAKKPAKQSADKPSAAKKAPQKNEKEQHQKPKKDASASKENSSGSVLDVIKQKGYDFVPSVTIKKTMIDFVGFSSTKIILFLVDKEHGDWLADEEKFNGEEPLWFSENSHRISPVRKAALAKEVLQAKLDGTGFEQDIEVFVINQMNNIINAEDMFEAWSSLSINVTRIDRGTPKEIPLFAKVLDQAEEKLDKSDGEKLKKILRGGN